MSVERWPWALPGGATVALSVAKNQLNIDLGKRAIEGSLSASADVSQGTSPLGHAEISLGFGGRSIAMRKLTGDFLGGKFDGNADINLDRPLQGNAQIRWSQLDSAKLVALSRGLEGLSGKYSGTITLSPAIAPRPLGPMRIDVNVATQDARYKTVQIGNDAIAPIHAVLFADTDRVVLDHGQIDVAGGRVRLWARVARNFTSQQLSVDYDNLELDPIARMNNPAGKPIPGLLWGNLVLIGSGANNGNLQGSGTIYLTQSDLGNFGPIAFLYDTMHVGRGSAPNGSGSVQVSYEQNILKIDNFSYFNRGIDVHGLATVGPLESANLSMTPVSGQIAGTARPLKGSRILMLADFDQAFGALQSGLTSVNISGTVGNMATTQVLADQLGATLKQLLVGEAKENSAEQ